MATAIKILRLPHARHLPLPRRATPGSAGFDLQAAIAEPLDFAPGSRLAVPTGLALELPPGFEGQVRPRSGLARNQLLSVLFRDCLF